MVTTVTQNLYGSANAVAQDQAQEEKIIVAAKAVAASTAKLLIAYQVEDDARSENNGRLQVGSICKDVIYVGVVTWVYTSKL